MSVLNSTYTLPHVHSSNDRPFLKQNTIFKKTFNLKLRQLHNCRTLAAIKPRIKVKRKPLLILLILLLYSCNESYKNEKIVELDCGIKLKVVTWGLTGDNKATYISINANLKDTLNEPYFRSLDFFYRVDKECNLVVYNSDELKRKNDIDTSISVICKDGRDVNYSNYKKLGFENILYK